MVFLWVQVQNAIYVVSLLKCFYSGAFVEALEYASGVKAEVVGKPEKSFFLEALNDLRVEPHEAIMIGDVGYSFVVSILHISE